jgi:hypothetical protein
MFPTDRYNNNIANLRNHYSHRLFINGYITDSKYCSIFGNVKSMLDFDSLIKYLDFEYDILVSGHLHVGQVCTLKNSTESKEHIYIGVPSLSNINIGKSIGYVINYNYNNYNKIESIDIEVLYSNNNLDINIQEIIHFDFNKNNKVLKRCI